MPTAIPGLPEYGTIEGVPLSTGTSSARFAWLATDLAEVRMPSALRGSNRRKPLAHGTSPTSRYKDESRRLIPMLFAGDCDSDGDPGAGSATEQVWLNLDEFTTLVLDPNPAVLTRTLTVVQGSLEWEGEITIEDFTYNMRSTAEIVGVIDVSIVGGRLTLGSGS